MNEKQKRNELCPCGSQKKYKKCCALQKAIQKQKHFSQLNQTTGPLSFMQGLTKRVFSVIGKESTSKQPKDLQSLKKD